ncbi:MAG: S53 family peptidase [Acidobacteriia bacterium]|nr:S53 family peptidase [Terriglobia bacterium]
MLKSLVALALCMPALFAQTRITQYVDDQQRVRLPGNRHPLAVREYDAGAVAPEQALDRMILVLTPDAGQQQELNALLESQHDPASPEYQRWLTPEEFGSRFGTSESDLAEVTRWLERHGFTVDEVPAGRRSIVFSGTASQVESAFHTQLRHYRVNGTRHLANASDVEIPRALAGLVGGISTLHDFGRQPLNSGRIAPEMTSSSGYHYLSPADFSVIYNVNPLYQSGIDGAGQTIAVVARTNINLADVTQFRSLMGLPANNPAIVLNGPDPGIYSQSEATEALLDVEWAGAVARKATVKLVISKGTSTTDGVDLSAQYIVNNNLASAMTTSFGNCEAFLGAAENLFWKNLYQQAAAQGITAFVSSGDSGAAGCDGASASKAVYARAVNGLASTPYNVAVGGTQFNDTQNPGLYWSPLGTASNLLSALSYIPETVWNESAGAGGRGLWATGGGASAIYAKPSWQSGPGVPADGVRDIPDVSLSAAGHVAYLVVQNGGLYAVGGTSASSPAFASLMALVVQQTGSRQGNANTSFYRLAAQQAAGGASIFHDISTGSNAVPGTSGYSAAAGFDLATGLGSVDAYQMATRWTNVKAQPDFQLTPATGSVQVQAGKGAPVAVSITLTNGFSSAIALSASGLPAGLTAGFAPATLPAPGLGTSTVTFTAAATTAPGTYSVTVTATGTGVSRQSTIAVTVTAAPFVKLLASSATLRFSSAASASTLVTVSVGGGFSSGITLSASNLPMGVTVSYAPASFAAPGAGSSVLTAAASAAALPGTYTVTLTAAGGSLTSSTTMSLTVWKAPDFSLGAASYNLTVLQNAAAAAFAQVSVLNGFSSAVTLSASGLPAGLSASFTPATLPAPGSGTSVLTLTAAAAAAPGTYTVVVTAAGGSLSRTMKLQVTVAVPPSLSLTPGASALSVVQGGSATLKATISVAGGFNAPVTFGATGLAAGITATFSPASLAAPGAGSSTVAISAAATVAAGVRTIYVSASAGGVTKTVAVAVTVKSAPLLVLPAGTSVTVAKGGSMPVPVTVKIAGPIAGAVNLRVTGLPAGIIATFAPSTFSALGNWATTLTLKPAATAPSGKWTINLTASDGVTTSSTPITVTVP